MLSSNIINLIQYFVTIILNKNHNKLTNLAIRIDLVMVIATIIIPIIVIKTKTEGEIFLIIIFLLLYVLFRYINKNTHKLYIKGEEEYNETNKKQKTESNFKYVLLLILSGISLFFVGDLLGITLENLCYEFKVPQMLIGLLLGFITSIPELITFMEAQKYHKKSENSLHGIVEATNNLFTSNILNLFIINSIGVLIYSMLA